MNMTDRYVDPATQDTVDDGDDIGLKELFATMVDYQVGKYEKKEGMCLTYVTQADGLYEVRENKLGVFTRKLYNHTFPALPKLLTEGVQLKIPKAPYSVWQDLLGFYRHFHNLHQTEVGVMVFYEPKTNKWIYYTPPQMCSPVLVDWNDEGVEKIKEYSEKYIPVMWTHSHHTMRGVFSSTDDKNHTLSDMLYLVIGNIFQNEPTFQIRFTVGDHKILIPITDVFETGDEYNLDLSKFGNWETNCIVRPIGSRETNDEQLDLAFGHRWLKEY